MLSEKFFLLLETLRSEAERSPTYSDGSTRVISTSPHVPVQLPAARPEVETGFNQSRFS